MTSSWKAPSAAIQIETLNAALQKSNSTAAQFCSRYLHKNAHEQTQQPPRKGTIKTFDDKTLVISGTIPMFADLVSTYEIVSEVKNGKEVKTEQKDNFLGFVNSVRKIQASNDYVVTLINAEGNDVAGIFKDSVYLESFSLDILPQCKNVEAADVIATFVSQDKDGKEYRRMVDASSAFITGWGPESNTNPANLEVALEETFTHEIPVAICPPNGEIVDGKCQRRLEQAVLTVGHMPDFRTYLKNTSEFQGDFAEVVGHNKAWVPEFSSFFIVDEASFNTLAKREQILRSKLVLSKDQCTAQFLLNMHRAVFETYLMQLNDMRQQPDITNSKNAAIMWLLYYTQLPVFVYKLLEMMVSESTKRNITVKIHSIVQAFHSELLKHLSGFSPVRDMTNSEQRDIVDNVRRYLEQLRVGVQEQMSNAVVRQTPECLGS